MRPELQDPQTPSLFKSFLGLPQHLQVPYFGAGLRMLG